MIDDVIRIAAEAGDACMKLYQRTIEVEHKSDDRGPLTEADRASHELIVEALGKLTPDIPVLSEESKEIDRDTRRSWTRFWLVDPLDGTKEFLKQTGQFTVNIALVEGHEVTLGVVHAPPLERFYHAVRGEGAYRRDGRGGPSHPISVAKPPGDPLRIATSVDHVGPREQELIDALGSTDVVRMGSSLKFCIVAEGGADLYPRYVPTMEWDTAAAQIVVEEAGGAILDESWQPLRYKKESLRNPSILTFGDPVVIDRVRNVGVESR